MTKLKCGVALGVVWGASLLSLANAQTKLTTTPAPGPAPTTAAPATTPAPAPPATPPAPAPAAAESGATAPVAGEPPPVEPATPPPAEPTPPPPVVLAEPPPEPSSVPDPAPDKPTAGPFRKGAVRLTLLLGTGTTVDDTYFIIGGGLGYFLADGFEVGLDYEAWIFAEPVMHRVSPETRYIFHMIPTIKPYIGVFYRHTFVNDYDDFNYLGARVGAYIAPARSRVYFGGGAVYERLLECEDNSFVDCDDIYPEITIGVSL